MGEVIKEAVTNNYSFWALTIAAIALIIAGFIVPPLGIIDGSVLTAVGELAGIGALWTIGHAIDHGIDAKLSHPSGMTIEVGDGS